MTATIADALQHAHEHGVIHRDLKPGNVMMDLEGKPHVLDFGLAKRESGEITMTVDGAIVGTPAYMSPEQARGDGHNADRRCDVYSLGVILFEMLTGELPFRGQKRMLIVQILTEDPPSLRLLNSEVPRDLETICLKCLNKEPDKRYDTSRALSDDLRRWLAGEPIQARPITRSERAVRWIKRNPRVAGLTSLLFALLIVIFLGGVYLYRSTDATRLVDALLKADTGELPGLLFDLSRYPILAQDELETAFRDSPEDSVAKLHAGLALLKEDEASLRYVQERLLELSAEQFKTVRDLMEGHKGPLIEDYWKIANDEAEEDQRRFRAACALASYDPENARWKDPSFSRHTSEHLVEQNRLFLSSWLESLRPVGGFLVPQLEGMFNDQALRQSERLAAANAIAYFVKEDAELLAKLMLVASGPQYNILYEAYREVANTQTNAGLSAAVQRHPTDDLDVASRIALGKERAISAITLLRNGDRELVFDVLRFEDDPEALTQFVHRCRGRDVTPRQLLELLETIDQRRGPLGRDRQKIDDSVMYALLLSLGEFRWDDLPSTKENTVQWLGKIYEKDPSRCVHSATGWLLRKWGHASIVDRVDQTPLGYDATGHREWFVREFQLASNGKGEQVANPDRICLTFIVFQQPVFTMGSRANEPGHMPDERQHQVTFTRPFAVCDREVTWAQWDAFDGREKRQHYLQKYGWVTENNAPVVGVSWFDAVNFCRWMGEQDGVSEDGQCYIEPALLKEPEDGEINSKDWPIRLERTGYRLLTEAEWELACRGRTVTPYAFGHDTELLDRYAWYLNNSEDWSHTTAQLRPNLQGLFDIHGNVFEWCHDRYNDGALSDEADPLGPDVGRSRLNRGGSWDVSARYCRSSHRSRNATAVRYDDVGFRLAFCPSNAK